MRTGDQSQNQLVELLQKMEAIRGQELGVAAISHRPTGVLKSFRDRQHITYRVFRS
jgi:hypothetical protein